MLRFQCGGFARALDSAGCAAKSKTENPEARVLPFSGGESGVH